MIGIKSPREIELMRKAGEITGETLKYLATKVKPGITTKELDKLAEDFVLKKGATPECKGFEGFPASICISVNDEVVHGIPGPRKLKEGDIVKLDFVANYKGYQGDSATTVPVGKIDDKKKYLIEHTEKALYKGLEAIHDGCHVGDIGYAIQKYAEEHNLGVVRELVGHGIGTQMHEDPDVPNYGARHTGPVLKEGMVIAVEPMLNLGTRRVYLLDDGWTIITADGKPSAHFEHTVLVTKDGYEILTRR